MHPGNADLKKLVMACGVLTALCAFPQQPGADSTLAASQPTEWANTGPFTVLGKSNETPYWVWAVLPAAVLESAKKTLSGEPTNWYVGRSLDWCETKNDVVHLEDTNGVSFSCLAHSNRWFLISEAHCTQGLSLALTTFLDDDTIVTNSISAARLLERATGLIADSARQTLTADFSEHLRKFGAEAWLTGTEKSETALAKLCVGPHLRLNGDRLAIECDVLNRDGAVERWEMLVDMTKPRRVLRIHRKQTHKNGTFSWGLVG